MITRPPPAIQKVKKSKPTTNQQQYPIIVPPIILPDIYSQNKYYYENPYNNMPFMKPKLKKLHKRSSSSPMISNDWIKQMNKAIKNLDDEYIEQNSIYLYIIFI